MIGLWTINIHFKDKTKSIFFDSRKNEKLVEERRNIFITRCKI